MPSRRAMASLVLLVALCWALDSEGCDGAVKALASAVFLVICGLVLLGVAASKVLLVVLLLPWTAWSGEPSYEGKVFLILGASGGIGKDIALNAAQRGAILVLAARRLDKLEEVAKECRLLGSEVSVVKVDVSNELETQFCIDFVKEKYNKLDLLILNAAIPGPWSTIDELEDPSILHQMMDINYWGYVTPTIQALPLLKQSQGDILVVSSMYGHIIAPYQAGYSATKHALHGFYQVLRQELQQHNMRVLVHCPGGILTEVQSKFQSGRGEPKALTMPSVFLGSSPACAQSILQQYDTGSPFQYYPSYVGAMVMVRKVFPDLFDFAFYHLTSFYFDSGLISLE